MWQIKRLILTIPYFQQWQRTGKWFLGSSHRAWPPTQAQGGDGLRPGVPVRGSDTLGHPAGLRGGRNGHCRLRGPLLHHRSDHKLIIFCLHLVKKFIDLPRGQVKDPLIGKQFSLSFLPETRLVSYTWRVFGANLTPSKSPNLTWCVASGNR